MDSQNTLQDVALNIVLKTLLYKTFQSVRK